MMTVSITFFYRPLSAAGSGGSLYMRIVYCRRAKQWALNCRLASHEWDRNAGRIVFPQRDKVRAEFLQKVSDKLVHHASVLREVVGMLEDSGKSFGVEDIYMAYVLYGSEYSLRGYTRCLTEEMERQGRGRTACAYRGMVTAFVNFCGGDLLLNDIVPSMISGFEQSMKTRSCRPNTVSHYLRILRAICNRAWRDGRMKHSPAEFFRNSFTGYASTPKRALSESELSLLLACDLPSLIAEQPAGSRSRSYFQGIYTAWRLFFFAFHACGMCFVDMACLKKENIVGDVISYCRKKTGRLVEISLTPSQQSIIGSFEADTQKSPYVFPLLHEGDVPLRRQYESAERSYNRRLKRLELLAGLEGHLTSHTARHTWASIGKNKLFPVGVLSACLGHSSEKTTHIYLSPFNRKILAEANRIITEDYRTDKGRQLRPREQKPD
jgi:integrase